MFDYQKPHKKKNHLMIKGGEHGYLGSGAKVVLNGVQLRGVKAITLDLNANNFMEARVLLRVNELHLDDCELDVLMEAVDA